MNEKVAVYKQDSLNYSKRPPYFPPAIYPEYPFDDSRTDKTNAAYGSLREALNLLGLDPRNFNTKKWNPFSSFISQGRTVLIKPNFVRHFNDTGTMECLITHGSVIRAVLDYAYIAMKGKGRLIVADGPMDEGDFEKIIEITGLDNIKAFYKDRCGFEIEILDLRQERVIKKDNKIIERIRLKGDPDGYTAVNLGNNSAFKKGSLDYKTFKGSECIDEIMFSHHNKDKDEYLISNTFLKADVVINIPKMKTHRKSGVTLSLKNMIGITGDRNWLPHFDGSFSRNKDNGQERGEENRRISMIRALTYIVKKIFKFTSIFMSHATRTLKHILKHAIGLRESDIMLGDWHGNDIMWRTIVDLARIAAYVDDAGIERQDRQRKSFVVVDGIIGGECDGPVDPLPKPGGVLTAGFNECCVDLVTARLMGFDPLKIPKFKNVLAEGPNKVFDFKHVDIICVSNIKEWNKTLPHFRGRCLGFKPYYGWKGHIEAR